MKQVISSPSANSINIGRLVPQVVYYVYAYAKLLQSDEIKDGENRSTWWCRPEILEISWPHYYAKQYGSSDRKTDLCIQ